MSAPQGPPLYKGEPLDAERGPGLGCFWVQVVALAVLLVLTPLTVMWGWDPAISAILLFVTLGLLLFAGQTVIFLLRLVAADRRSRRRPLDPTARPTIGQMEAAGQGTSTSLGAASTAPPPSEASLGEAAGAPGDAPAGPGDTPAPSGDAGPSPAALASPSAGGEGALPSTTDPEGDRRP